MGKKIAIAAQSQDFNDTAAKRFARCEWFAIYNHDRLTYTFHKNEAKQEASGAGNKAAKILADLDVASVLVPEIGPKAFDILDAFDITVYRYEKSHTIKDALYAYYEGKLLQITHPTKQGHH